MHNIWYRTSVKGSFDSQRGHKLQVENHGLRVLFWYMALVAHKRYYQESDLERMYYKTSVVKSYLLSFEGPWTHSSAKYGSCYRKEETRGLEKDDLGVIFLLVILYLSGSNKKVPLPQYRVTSSNENTALHIKFLLYLPDWSVIVKFKNRFSTH